MRFLRSQWLVTTLTGLALVGWWPRRRPGTGYRLAVPVGLVLLAAACTQPAPVAAPTSAPQPPPVASPAAKPAASPGAKPAASPAPSPAADGFPAAWPVYAGNPEHNAAFEGAGAAKAIRDGVTWNFAMDGALPLDGPPADLAVLGPRGAPVKTTQFLGAAVGVTAVGGVIYAESDHNHVYALDAVTGQLLWETPTVNAMMGNPIVADGIVVAGAGDTGFSFEQVMAYAQKRPVVRGLGLAAIYGLDARTGQVLWKVPTLGEAMPSLAYRNGVVYEGLGDGNVYALDIKTGALKWKTYVGGFASMSSANVWQNQVFVGFTNPNFVYSLDADTGKVLWKQTLPGVANTGMGDNSPVVDSQRGIVVQDSVVDPQRESDGKVTVDLDVWAMDAANEGKILWQTKLGRGPNPPAYKAGVAMIHNGVVYVGSPATSRFYALDETTGQIIWALDIPQAGPAGAGRGAATFYQGTVWLAAGPNLFAIDPASGQVLATYPAGGRYGIVNPVIVSGTMYLANSWGWVQAVPLSAIYPDWRKRGS